MSAVRVEHFACLGVVQQIGLSKRRRRSRRLNRLLTLEQNNPFHKHDPISTSTFPIPGGTDLRPCCGSGSSTRQAPQSCSCRDRARLGSCELRSRMPPLFLSTVRSFSPVRADSVRAASTPLPKTHMHTRARARTPLRMADCTDLHDCASLFHRRHAPPGTWPIAGFPPTVVDGKDATELELAGLRSGATITVDRAPPGI